MINKKAVQNKGSWEKAMNRLATCDVKEEPIIIAEICLLNQEFKKMNGGKNEPTK